MRRLSMLPPPAMLLPNAPWMCRSPATPPPVTAGKETGTEDHDKKKNAQSCHFSICLGRGPATGATELRWVPVALGRHLL